ncbi:hypothetical protein NMG60_11024775 [Bertholletia excelsa]
MPPKHFPLRWESTGDHWWYASPIDCAAANGHYELVRKLLRIDPNLLIKLTSLRRIRRLETVWDDEAQSNTVAKCRSQEWVTLGNVFFRFVFFLINLVSVPNLLRRDPLLVFGEGEYGVTDILYAAARSKDSEVFREEKMEKGGFRWEIMNRAVHAAARGGNVEILESCLGRGSTVLHAASGRGQVEGYPAVVETLILASPSVTSITNNYGDTFLHMAVAGFRSPGFRRMDCQIKLMKQLVGGKLVNLQDSINIRNKEGRTALHMAVSANIQPDLVGLLLTVPSIDLNICDCDGMTAIDLFKQKPQSASSEVLIKRDFVTRNALASYLKVEGIGCSPGTSFRIPDAEILLHTRIDNTLEAFCDPANMEYSTCSSNLNSPALSTSQENKKSNPINNTARRLKLLLRWPRKERNVDSDKPGDNYSADPFKLSSNLQESPTTLQERFANDISLPSNHRLLSFPSPSSNKKFSARLMQGLSARSPSSSVYSDSSRSSPASRGYEIRESSNHRSSSLNKRLMNQYLCLVHKEWLQIIEPTNIPVL